MTTPIGHRASSSSPCLVCGSGSKGCSVTTDGLHLCRGEPRPGWKRITREPDSMGFHHYRNEEDRPPHTNGTAVPKTATDWNSVAAKCAEMITDELRLELANDLKMPVESLLAIRHLGYKSSDNHGPCWTFPERDPTGAIVGLNRRYADGSKKAVGNRGLTFPAAWIRPGPTFIVEGASDTIALSLCGVSAIGRPSNLGGREMILDVIKDNPDRQFIIVGENDRKPDTGLWPGKDGALAISSWLTKELGKPIKWTLPPADYKDARAWVLDSAAGAGETVDWQSIGREISSALSLSARIGDAVSLLPLHYFKDITAGLDTSDFVEDLLITGGMTVIYGESGCGKTYFTLDLALHVAAGWPWRGREIERCGVIYIALEGSHGISNRVAAFKSHHNCNALDLPFAIVPVSVDLCTPDADTTKVIQAAVAAAQTVGITVGLIVIDTLSRAMAGGNENSPDDMGSFVRNVDLIRQTLPAHVVIVHHSGKDQSRGARGHSLLRAATDTEIEVFREPTTKRSIARVTKQRELDCSGEFAFTLLVVELGHNRRGKPVTSCVVKDASDETSAEERSNEKSRLRMAAIENDNRTVMLAVEAEQAAGQHGATERQIRDRTGYSQTRVRASIERLVEEGSLVRDKWVKTTGKGAASQVTGVRIPVTE